MHDGITSSIEQLGYAVNDIRILLASHAHFDVARHRGVDAATRKR